MAKIPKLKAEKVQTKKVPNKPATKYLFTIDFTNMSPTMVMKMALGFLFQPVILFVMCIVSAVEGKAINFIKLTKKDDSKPGR